MTAPKPQYAGRRATAAEKNAAAAAARAEEEARLGKIYGKLLPDVLFLRGRDNAVMKEGGRLKVNGREVTAEQLKELAARERRLAGAAPVSEVRRVQRTASGLKLGQVVEASGPRVSSPTAQRVLSPEKQKLAGAALAAKRRSEEHSTDLGVKPRVVWLDLGLLDVDRSYQREIGQKGGAHVSRLLKAFNWNCYQPIIVSDRGDGRFAVIDGQHRLEAAKKHPLIDSLPCYVIDAPGVAQQAAVFVAVNSRRLSLTSQQQFFAAVAAGDPAAVEAMAAARAAGVTILRTPPSYDIPARSILSPATLLKLLRTVGRPAVGAALKLLAEAHPDTLNAFRAPTIAALCRLTADKAIDRTRLKAIVAGVDLGKLHDGARQARVAQGGTVEAATERALRDRYSSATPAGLRRAA